MVGIFKGWEELFGLQDLGKRFLGHDCMGSLDSDSLGLAFEEYSYPREAAFGLCLLRKNTVLLI